MSKKIIAVFILTCLGSISAQTFIGKLNPFPENQSASSNDTIKILGIMVDFQEDKDESTFGNGKFGSIYTSDYGTTILDPLPHNKAYFEDHLEFVKNYFNKASRGKTAIEYFILPATITVSKTMRNYSPDPNSDDFTSLANFSKEVWTIAQTNNPGFNFNSYDLFTIFHAGVGRDVSLPGSLGSERDLPSVFLSDKALKKTLSDLSGLPLNRNGEYNSLIIPETESRENTTLTGTALYQISINGLLAASVGSYLGLPDLFDTETGVSAIGRFGLMDGQAIFAYNGTFPPEPSAWEKIYLGWEEPVTVQPGNYNINLVTKNAAAVGDTVILKVPLNSSEYFLVENRIRDANSDGAKVTYILNGIKRTKTFTKDTTGFLSYDVDSLRGVITDVDEYDWALPSIVSANDGKYYPKPGGGIVIWHIDENVIKNEIGDNRVNVDKNDRGVDVEEADGVQDIGESFQDIFGDLIIGEGYAEDFWYAGNPAQLYENKFSKDTRPNTNTNSGANSLITFSNFSPKSNRMSFKLSYGDSLIVPIVKYNLSLPVVKSLTYTPTGSEQFSFSLLSDSALYNLLISDYKKVDNSYSDFKTAFYNAGNQYILGVRGSYIYQYLADGSDYAGYNVGEKITTPMIFRKNSSGADEFIIGTEKGKVKVFTLDAVNGIVLAQEFSADEETPVRFIAASENYISFVTDKKLYDSNGKSYLLNNSTPGQVYSLVLTKLKDSRYVSVIHYNDKIFVVADGELSSSFSVNDGISSISIADLKNDGENYILFTDGNNLNALNLQGASADNFPIADPHATGFSGTPVAADFEGDSKSEIITSTKDGRIFAIDGGTGKIVNGFPISTGAQLETTPVLFNYNGKASLAAIDVQNNFYAWNIGAIDAKMFWSEANGNNYNSSFVDKASNNAGFSNQFFPSNRVYNYPNPVYDNTTYIRYYVSEDSKINIKIFDLAGDFVAELNDNAVGGFDNETKWDVNDIQSGVYLARVEATGSSGRTESNIIKIAIIK